MYYSCKNNQINGNSLATALLRELREYTKNNDRQRSTLDNCLTRRTLRLKRSLKSAANFDGTTMNILTCKTTKRLKKVLKCIAERLIYTDNKKVNKK